MSKIKVADLPISEEYREYMLEVLSNRDAWRAIVATAEALCRSIEKDVLNYDLAGGQEKLAYKKANADGARKMLSLLNNLTLPE